MLLPAKMYQGFSYSELSDIVQLDGPADNSDVEGENGAPLEENDFLGIINAEAIKALQEGDGSSDGNSISSSSDSEGADELANVEEEVRERESLMFLVFHTEAALQRLFPLEMTFISHEWQVAHIIYSPTALH